jgi:hypothetical protein
MEEDAGIPAIARSHGAAFDAAHGWVHPASWPTCQNPQVRNASKAWAMRIPTLRTTKNAVIASNIDDFRAMDSTKGSAVCTVKKISLYETNFVPR